MTPQGNGKKVSFPAAPLLVYRCQTQTASFRVFNILFRTPYRLRWMLRSLSSAEGF